MSNNAQRYSKRQVHRQASMAVKELNARADKIKGRIVITPRAALKGYVKWTQAIKRAIRPLAEQFGFRVISRDGGKMVIQ